MPFAQKAMTPPNDRSMDSITIATEKGHLVAVSLFPENSGTGINEYYGEVWLVSTETPEPTRLIMLAAGGFGKQYAISWTGRIPCEPSQAVVGYAGCLSTNIQPVRLTVFTDVE